MINKKMIVIFYIFINKYNNNSTTNFTEFKQTLKTR